MGQHGHGHGPGCRRVEPVSRVLLSPTLVLSTPRFCAVLLLPSMPAPLDQPEGDLGQGGPSGGVAVLIGATTGAAAEGRTDGEG